MPKEYIAQIAGYYLDMVDVTDTIEKSLVVHEYINSPKNKIEDLGSKTRRIAVECVFQDNLTMTPGWNTEYGIFPTYDAHIDFLEYINLNRESILFTHPKYGELSGKIEKISTFHDDTINYAKINFDFLQEIIEYEPKFVQHIVPQIGKGFRETAEKTDEIIKNDEKDSTDTIQWTAQATIYRNELNTYLSGIENNVQSLIYQIDYGTDVPGLMLQDVNEAIDRIVEFYITSRSAPASFINNLIFGVRQLKGIFTGIESRIVHVMGASMIAYETSVIIDEDEQKRKNIDNKSFEETFDIAGNYKEGEAYDSTLTVNELEDMLFEVRTLIDEAIQLDRDNRALQQQARYLQEYVNQIKLDRERIVTVSVSEQSLFTVLNNYDLNYQLADKILRMNDIKNPNFVNGNVDIII